MFKKHKIVFFGTSKFTQLILEALKQVNLMPILLIATPDKARGRGLKTLPSLAKIWAKENKIDVWQPENLKDENFIKDLRNISADLFVVASYGKIIPKDVLDLPFKGSINIHPSLLPKYRGSSPIQSAILSGDDKTGATLILVDEKMDHGPILAQQELEFSIFNFQFSKLEIELAKLSGELLIDTIPKWIEGDIQPQEQNHANATFTKKIEKKDGQIDWKDNAEVIYKKVLALNPWPGTYTFWLKPSILSPEFARQHDLELKPETKSFEFSLKKRNTKLIRVIITEAGIIKKPADKKAGEVFEINNSMAVACGSDAILIKSLKVEGKKETTSEDFLKGNHSILGAVL